MPRTDEFTSVVCPLSEVSEIGTDLARGVPFFLRFIGAALYLLLLFTFSKSFIINASAQSTTATLSGIVTDQAGAVVPDVNIAVINVTQAVERATNTNSEGVFVVTSLLPGNYTVKAEHEGFNPAELRDVILNVNDQRMLKIVLKVGQLKSATVDVVDSPSLIDESSAVATTVDRQFVQHQPLNGRSFQSLMALTPGVVLTKATSTEQGQFSVNGQRANANYFTIDGAGANIGVGVTFQPGQASAGSVPGFNAFGGTNNLVSVDALQEFKVQTSAYAPEFGRQPGGQVSIVTRSGTNEFHGSFFEYFRNDVLDAADWFVNRNGQSKPPLRQNIFGGVFGGPVLLPRFGEGGDQPWYNGRQRTFFFLSYEGQRVRQPTFRQTSVPSLAVRQNAPPQLRAFLNAFPLPNGPNQTNGFAQFNASFSNPSTSDATSIRIDHKFTDRVTLFGRYNYAPSSTVQRGAGNSLNTLNPVRFRTQTVTLGSTQVFSTNISNEVRINHSRNKGSSHFFLDNFGGAVVPPDSLFFPSFTSRESGKFDFQLLGTGGNWSVGPNVDSEQRQFNLVENLSIVTGSHQIKFGVDYRRLSPVFSARSYFQSVLFLNANQALTGIPSSVQISAQEPATAIVTNLSTYAQDIWKINQRLSLTYGMRYEVNPAPSGNDDQEPIAITDANNFANLAFSPPGTSLYETTYNNFAPRIGTAYQLSQRSGRETILRAGFGVFYDIGGGAVINALSAGYPFTASKTLTGVPFPLLSAADARPPTVPPTLPVNRLFAVDPELKLPYTLQWNVAAEQSLGANQTFSVTYAGAVGRRLLRAETVARALNSSVFALNPALFTSTAVLFLTRNAAISNYRSLQLQFQRRLSKRVPLQILTSYTWARSVDTASNDSSISLTPTGQIDPQLDLGPSDFDVRHALSGAISFDIPALNGPAVVRGLFKNWSIDTNFIARTATPVDVTFTRFVSGTPYNFRPNLVDGVPLYLEGPNFPGGKRINPAAFSPGTQLAHGTLTRNALRGFFVSQLDLAVRRKFNLTEGSDLQFRVDFFNIFNHPNFGDPLGPLGTFTPGFPFTPQSTFGLSNRTLAQSLGTGGTGGGFSPLYQIGGPRSIQFSLRWGF